MCVIPVPLNIFTNELTLSYDNPSKYETIEDIIVMYNSNKPV